MKGAWEKEIRRGHIKPMWVPTKRMWCHPRGSVGRPEWGGRGLRKLLLFPEPNPESRGLGLGSSVTQLQRRWASGGGSSLLGLSRDSSGGNLTPPPPPGQLLQSIRRGRTSRALVAFRVGFAWESLPGLRRAMETSSGGADSKYCSLSSGETRSSGGRRAKGAWSCRERPGRRTEQWRGARQPLGVGKTRGGTGSVRSK